MANEISTNFQLGLINGNLNDPGPNLGQILVGQSVAALWKRTVTLTAAADTDVGALVAGITTAGICYIFNLDATNYVQWGPNNAGAIDVIGKLKPKDIPAVFRLDPSFSLRMKANTGNCEILICIYED
ncbi:MAG: hypothetical protein KGO96_12810 [Elusimicrobia bacterium]|nr:hypothetical protein [Elusimicrobiota bacterium]